MARACLFFLIIAGLLTAAGCTDVRRADLQNEEAIEVVADEATHRMLERHRAEEMIDRWDDHADRFERHHRYPPYRSDPKVESWTGATPAKGGRR